MKWILAVASDLMFTVKIQDAAKRAGASSVFVSNQMRALERMAGGDPPTLVILDLDFSQADPIALIPLIRAKDIPAIGYLSHVHLDLKRKAEEAGCSQVIARSALDGWLNQKLPDIIAASLA
jgi:CheY-like chemotaxis protein